MSIPNTANLTPLFVERLPDWSRSVRVTISHSTGIFESRSGLEQRDRARARARWAIQYDETGLSPAQFNIRSQRAAVEAAYPCYVPFWTEGGRVVSRTAATIILDFDPVPGMWEPEQKAYIGGAFYDITVKDGRDITLSTEPPVSAGATAYPVRLCRRMIGDDKFSGPTPARWMETLAFETID